MAFYLNPKRTPHSFCKGFVIRSLTRMGFKNIDYYYVHGEGRGNSVYIGDKVSLCDAVLNISCGDIRIGSNTVFGHNVMVITGFHQFHEGTLAKLSRNRDLPEVPFTGHDISIGSGCFIGSNAIILKGVIIGDNSIIAAGSIITKDVPAGSFFIGNTFVRKT